MQWKMSAFLIYDGLTQFHQIRFAMFNINTLKNEMCPLCLSDFCVMLEIFIIMTCIMNTFYRLWKAVFRLDKFCFTHTVERWVLLDKTHKYTIFYRPVQVNCVKGYRVTQTWTLQVMFSLSQFLIIIHFSIFQLSPNHNSTSPFIYV